jgi:hypothetical protein
VSRRSRRSALSLALAALAATPGQALAHGGVTGTRDVVQDYGVLVFLLAVVLIGAGVVAWVVRAPEGEDEEDEPAPQT